MSVGELTKAILRIWDRPNHPIEVQGSPLHEAQILRLDIAKALSRLSWRPRLGVHEALVWTARWYKEYYQKPQNARAATQDQICSFASSMDLPRGEG